MKEVTDDPLVQAAVARWRARRAAADDPRRVTLIDLYELVAQARGVAVDDLPAAQRRSLAQLSFAEAWPGWDPIPGPSRRADPVRLAAADPRWPAAFAAWRDAIARALGPAARGIAHVGSTAVPGLAAKPIVDIQVSVDDLDAEPAYVPGLESLGLVLRSRDRLHRLLCSPPEQARGVNVHVCALGGSWEREHLLFRDFLRADPDAAAGYERAKRASLRRWADDRAAYTDAKTATILDALRAAERWAAATGWSPPSR